MVSKKIKSIFNKTPNVKPDFKSLNFNSLPKTDADLKVKIDGIKNKSLKKRLLNSKLFWIGGTAMGLSTIYVDQYIKGNTGCFLVSKNNTCKIAQLSCCNPYTSNYVENCSDEIIQRLQIDPLACKNYDPINNPSCCEMCDCKYYPCESDEEMKCHRATVGEALTYFTENMTSTVSDTFYSILTSSGVLKIITITFFTILIGLIIYKMI